MLFQGASKPIYCPIVSSSPISLSRLVANPQRYRSKNIQRLASPIGRLLLAQSHGSNIVQSFEWIAGQTTLARRQRLTVESNSNSNYRVSRFNTVCSWCSQSLSHAKSHEGCCVRRRRMVGCRARERATYRRGT
jgi:hypothetical protein